MPRNPQPANEMLQDESSGCSISWALTANASCDHIAPPSPALPFSSLLCPAPLLSPFLSPLPLTVSSSTLLSSTGRQRTFDRHCCPVSPPPVSSDQPSPPHGLIDIPSPSVSPMTGLHFQARHQAVSPGPGCRTCFDDIIFLLPTGWPPGYAVQFQK